MYLSFTGPRPIVGAGSRAFFASLFRRWGFACFPQDLPRCGDSPSVETKIPVSLQLFCDYGLFPVPEEREWLILRLISCAFALRSATGGHAAIPNRKKVAIWAAILFLGFRSGLGQRGSGARGIDCRTGKKAAPWGGPDGRHGIFRAALGGRFGRPVDRWAWYCVPHPPCFPCRCSRCSMPAHHYHLQFHSILLWRGLPSWKNWSTLKKPVVQGVSLKELARASALGD